jgi:hypothetical protein
MILDHEPIARPHSVPRQRTAVATTSVVPRWLRRAIDSSESIEESFAFGGALALLDGEVRANRICGGVWRQRLALSAATATARRLGRVQGEAALRDAVLLTRPGDAVGPAGDILLGWRLLVEHHPDVLVQVATLERLADLFGQRLGDAVLDSLNDLLTLCAEQGLPRGLATLLHQAPSLGVPRDITLWLTDALLAKILRWERAVAVFGNAAGSASERRSPAESEAGRAPQAKLHAAAGAAIRAIDLVAELVRRSDTLLSVAPKLRAKGSDNVVAKLLGEDAAVASQPILGMSDRGLRRIFERLVELGAVRELSGRPTFRIYGL